METITIYIYDQSRLLEAVEATPSIAWRAAITSVKSRAREQGLASMTTDGWYQTQNTIGFSRGNFRCIPKFAGLR